MDELVDLIGFIDEDIADEIQEAYDNGKFGFYYMDHPRGLYGATNKFAGYTMVSRRGTMIGQACTLAHEWQHVRDRYINADGDTGPPLGSDGDVGGDCHHATITEEELKDLCALFDASQSNPEIDWTGEQAARYEVINKNYAMYHDACLLSQGIPWDVIRSEPVPYPPCNIPL
jgi:hypothetical protein